MASRVGRFIHISTCSVYWCTGDFLSGARGRLRSPRISPNDPAASNTTSRYNKRKAEETLLAAHRAPTFPSPRSACRSSVAKAISRCVTRRIVAVSVTAGRWRCPTEATPRFVTSTSATWRKPLPACPVPRRASGRPTISPAAKSSRCGRHRGDCRTAREAGHERGHSHAGPARDGPRHGLLPFSQQASQVPAIYKARRDLGWSPTPYAVWLERAVRWSVDTLGKGASRRRPTLSARASSR